MDYTIHLTEEQERAFTAVCSEIYEKTGNKVIKQDMIDQQVAYYIKRMLQSYVKVPIPDELLEGLDDQGQADLYARVIIYYPGFVEEMKTTEDEPEIGMWARIKNFITGGG